MSPQLKWSRPSNVAFPSVWLRFEARDVDSDALVEYRIQDLPEDRFEDAIKHMTQYFLADHTIGKTKNLVRTDPDYVGDYHRAWRAVLQQRMTLACFRNGSDEIVGFDMSYVLTADDPFTQEILKLVSSLSAATVGLLLIPNFLSRRVAAMTSRTPSK